MGRWYLNIFDMDNFHGIILATKTVWDIVRRDSPNMEDLFLGRFWGALFWDQPILFLFQRGQFLLWWSSICHIGLGLLASWSDDDEWLFWMSSENSVRRVRRIQLTLKTHFERQLDPLVSLSYRDISIWGKLELAATPFPPSTFRARSFTLAVSKKIDASWLVSGAIHLFIDICIHQFHKTHTCTHTHTHMFTVTRIDSEYIYICVCTQCSRATIYVYIYIFPHISCRCIGSYLSYLISESWAGGLCEATGLSTRNGRFGPTWSVSSISAQLVCVATDRCPDVSSVCRAL